MTERRAPSASQRDRLREPRFYTGEVIAELNVYRTTLGDVAVSTIGDAGKAGPNEDSAAILPVDDEHLVLVVADGVGGLPVARRASNLAVQTIHRTLENHDGDSNQLRTSILDGIEAANQALLDLGTGSATTLALVEIGPGYARSYHVGDSIVLMCGQRGKVKLQTVPHSPVGFAMESGLLDEAQALRHAELNLISNVLGSTDMRIEMGPRLGIAARDTILLASDGLTDNLLQDEIVAVIRKGTLERSIQALTALTQDRMMAKDADLPSKPDDFTAVLFRPGNGR